MRIALDTHGYVDLCKGVEDTVALVEDAETVLLPFVVLGELRAGFALGRRQADNERTLRQFLLKQGVHVLFADGQTTHHYASVFRQLRKQGTPIPTNDMWLADADCQPGARAHLSRDLGSGDTTHHAHEAYKTIAPRPGRRRGARRRS